jgi:membrane-associated protein
VRYFIFNKGLRIWRVTMEMNISKFISSVLNFEEFIYMVINQYGIITYLILFTIIFAEAGLIIFVFLPGDSLLFLSGTLSSIGFLNVHVTFLIFCAAVLVGDTINYYIGKFFGKRILHKENHRFLKKDYVDKAHNFYQKHGRLAIIMGRFIPVVRSFVAFVAGLGAMEFSRFILYASIGGILRVILFLFAGYYFGNLQIVRDNLEKAIFLVTCITMIPAVIGFIRQKSK